MSQQLGYEDARAAAHAAVGVPELVAMAKRNLSHGSHFSSDEPTARFAHKQAAMDHLFLADVAAQVAIAEALGRIADALEAKS